MNTTIINRTALNDSCHARYNRIVYDGCNYLAVVDCLQPDIRSEVDLIKNYIDTCRPIKQDTGDIYSRIYKYDSCLEFCRKYDTARKYDFLCYDYQDDSYYADCAGSGRYIYKLSCYFTEIDCIQIDVPRAVGKLTDISYDCSDDRIIAAYTCGIFAVDKCTGEVDVLYRPVCDWIMGINKCCGLYFTVVLRCHKYMIVIYDERFSELGILPFCAHELPVNVIDCGDGYVDCLIRKCGKYYYIYRIELPVNIRCSCQVRRRHCRDCRDEVCADMVESVARVECALSHILNAEGEKLQKVIAESSNVEELLCVNKSVNRMVDSITKLEFMLQSKLQLFDDCLCDSCRLV